jgi:hypothetical protein
MNGVRDPIRFVERSRYSDPNVAARKLVEIANGVEPVQDGCIFIERVNGPSSRLAAAVMTSAPGFCFAVRPAVRPRLLLF